ncbi:MAG: hypothetical protein EXS64_01430 [Candidatus Latescibacteria bacterium]|nr:hypothetical protein [Candidatus Latescibacterota bacterium]
MALRKDRGRSLAPPLLYALVSLLWAGQGVSQSPRPPIRLEVAAGQIALIDRSRGDTLRYARAGDTVVVDVLVNSGKGRPLTGVEFYLRFDPAFLSPVDADTSAPGLQPVRSEGLIRRAEGITNTFNVGDPTRYRGIHYAEGLLTGSTTADSGRAASVAFRMLQAIPPGGDVTVSVERDTLIFRSSYQVQTAAGLTFPLRPRNALHITALPPVLNLPASLTVRADSALTLDLTPLATDPEFGGSLRWAVTARDSGVAVTVDDSMRTGPDRAAPGVLRGHGPDLHRHESRRFFNEGGGGASRSASQSSACDLLPVSDRGPAGEWEVGTHLSPPPGERSRGRRLPPAVEFHRPAGRHAGGGHQRCSDFYCACVVGRPGAGDADGAGPGRGLGLGRLHGHRGPAGRGLRREWGRELRRLLRVCGGLRDRAGSGGI